MSPPNPSVEELKMRLRATDVLDVVARVAARHHVTLDAVLGRRRWMTVCAARSEAIALVHWTLVSSLHQTGWLFGRDHSTILHHLRERERDLAIEHGLTPRVWKQRARKTPRRSTFLRLVPLPTASAVGS